MGEGGLLGGWFVFWVWWFFCCWFGFVISRKITVTKPGSWALGIFFKVTLVGRIPRSDQIPLPETDSKRRVLVTVKMTVVFFL